MFTLSHHVTLLTSLAALVLALPPATVTAGAAGTNQGFHIEAPATMRSIVHIATNRLVISINEDGDITCGCDTGKCNRRDCERKAAKRIAKITELEAEVKALKEEIRFLQVFFAKRMLEQINDRETP